MEKLGTHRYPQNAAAVAHNGQALDLLARLMRAHKQGSVVLDAAALVEASDLLRRVGVEL